MTREPQRSVRLLYVLGATKHNIISNAGWKQPDGQ